MKFEPEFKTDFLGKVPHESAPEAVVPSAAAPAYHSLEGEFAGMAAERTGIAAKFAKKIGAIKNRFTERTEEERELIAKLNDDLVGSFPTFSQGDIPIIRAALRNSGLTSSELAPALTRLEMLGKDLSIAEFALLELCATFRAPVREKTLQQLKSARVIPLQETDVRSGYMLTRAASELRLFPKALNKSLVNNITGYSFSETSQLLRALRLSKQRDIGKENRAISQALYERINEATPDMLIPTFRELGVSRIMSPQLSHTLIYRLMPEVEKMTLQDTAESMRSMGMLHAEVPNFGLALADKLCGSMEKLSWKQIALTALGIGEMRYTHSTLVREIIKRVDEERALVPAREVGSLAWGLSVVTSDEQFKKVWDRVWDHEKDPILFRRRESLRMLSLVSHYRRMPLPPLLAAHAQAFAGEAAPRHPEQVALNGFESDVARTLKALGIDPQAHVRACGVTTDFVFNHNGHRVALFCDGARYHYIGTRKTALICGSDLIASEALKNQNYQVVRISDRLWRGSGQQKVQLLDGLLPPPPQIALPR